MTLNQFEKLKEFKTASFALWNPNHKKFTDTEYIKENLKSLHTRIIILGLNPSRRVKINFLENFHKLGRGGRDRWYAEAFNKEKEPFCGAYMSDFIFYPETNSKEIELKWKEKKSFRKNNIKNLKKQFKILNINNPVIICIGRCTKLLLSQCKEFCEEFSITVTNIYTIGNTNGYRKKGAKEKFINDVKNLGKNIKKIIKLT